MTAANSTPLSDGASSVLLASEEWAKERGLPILAYITEAQTAAVDHVHKREGLLMAPAYAMPTMLDRAGLALQDFDYYEIHEAFAAQVLCTLKAWEDAEFCKEKLGRDKPLGAIDRAKLNVNGGSLAAAHPFAATGGRIVAGLAKQLHEDGKGRGVISICAAGGQGVVAILESAARRQEMSDRYAQLVNAPVVSHDRQAGRAATAGRARPLPAGPAGRRRPGPDRRRPRRPAREADQGAARPGRRRTRRHRGQGEGARLRRHRDRRLDRAGRAAALLLPGRRPAAALRPRRRPRHDAGRGRVAPRPHRPARARGLRPQPGEGDRRPRRHRPARLRRPRRRGAAGLDPALPALAALGLRRRPGDPGRQGRRPAPDLNWDRPLARKVALVTGAARGSAPRSPPSSPATGPR